VWLASGVTAVADGGGPFWNFDVRDAAAASAAAPRVKVAGPLVSTQERAPVHRMDLDDPPIIAFTSPDDARALVRRELARKPDFVKVWFLHGPKDDLDHQREIAKAAGDEGHTAGVRFAVHATELDVAKAALRAGADVLVHSVFDKPVDDELIDLARGRHAVYVPTLYVKLGYAQVFTGTWAATEAEKRVADPQILATMGDVAKLSPKDLPDGFAATAHKREADARKSIAIAQKNLARVHAAGILIALGTDAGNIGTLHGPSVFREMALMQEAGLSPRDVLVAATSGGANVLGMERELGLEPGRFADLVVLDADPLAAVPKGTEIRWVMKGGVLASPEDLLAPIR
jgi:imidazolonepropionase-like amidohydrolase